MHEQNKGFSPLRCYIVVDGEQIEFTSTTTEPCPTSMYSDEVIAGYGEENKMTVVYIPRDS